MKLLSDTFHTDLQTLKCIWVWGRNLNTQ